MHESVYRTTTIQNWLSFRAASLVTLKVSVSLIYGIYRERVGRPSSLENNWSERGDNRKQSCFSLLTRIIVDARTMSTRIHLVLRRCFPPVVCQGLSSSRWMHEIASGCTRSPVPCTAVKVTRWRFITHSGKCDFFFVDVIIVLAPPWFCRRSPLTFSPPSATRKWSIVGETEGNVMNVSLIDHATSSNSKNLFFHNLLSCDFEFLCNSSGR